MRSSHKVDPPSQIKIGKKKKNKKKSFLVNFKIPVTDTEPFRNQNQSAPFELHIPLSRVLIA